MQDGRGPGSVLDALEAAQVGEGAHPDPFAAPGPADEGRHGFPVERDSRSAMLTFPPLSAINPVEDRS